MNNDQVMGKWHQVKGQVRQKFGKLSDDEIERTGGRREELAGLVQERYGKTREEAHRMVDDAYGSL
ncbi:MAG: CsbD family protein [Sumerlaeia bacterium]